MIRKWHVIISGYTQTEGVLHGCQALRYTLQDAVAARDSIVIQPPWNHNFKALASSIANDPSLAVKIYVYAYSWGCGNGLIKFAEALAEQETEYYKYPIQHAVLCDPVYHSQRFEDWPVIGHLMRGIGVLRQGKIKVPKNVLQVSSFRQRRTVPVGCDLVPAKGATTIINPSVQLFGRGHNEMDDAPEWHLKCLQVAEAA